MRGRRTGSISSATGAGPREILFVGMNPGPFGMAQNGVPFGDTAMVRDWLGIEAPVERPRREHPKRPVLGLRMTRGEVSGARLWGWARGAFRDSGAILPARLRVELLPTFLHGGERAERHPRQAAPRRARAPVRGLRRCTRRGRSPTSGPVIVVGIGAFAAWRAAPLAEAAGAGVRRRPPPEPREPRRQPRVARHLRRRPGRARHRAGHAARLNPRRKEHACLFFGRSFALDRTCRAVPIGLGSVVQVEAGGMAHGGRT